jgi:hypothetical protein
MSTWLFNSSGNPVAFVNGDSVFYGVGTFLGKLDGKEVWNGSYVGEIVGNNYLVRKSTYSGANKMSPMVPMSPMTPMSPMSRAATTLPSGYEDIE